MSSATRFALEVSFGLLLALVLSATLPAPKAAAAPIDWIVGPTTTIDENDISTTGVLVHAGSWGSSEETVLVRGEDIVFENRDVLPVGTTDGEVGASGSNETSDPGFFVPSGPIDHGFHNVLDSFTFNGMPVGSQMVVTLDGLTPGRTYEVQLFVSDDRGCCAGRTHNWSDEELPAGNQTGNFTGGSSSYVIGVFTADATTQTVYQASSSANSNVLNAYVLNDVTVGTSAIDWIEGPTTTVDENDIDTNGILVHAGTWGSAPATVTVDGEDIPFEAREFFYPPGMTDGEIGANGGGAHTIPDAFIPTGAIDPSFHAILDGFLFNSTPFGQLTVTLDRLIPGRTYQVQLFLSDDRSCCATRPHNWSDQMFPNGNQTGEFTGGSSSYVIGVFTAETPIQQVFQWSEGNAHTVNAYVLRELPVSTTSVEWITPPTTTVDENDISTFGELVHAGSWGTSDITVTVDGEDILFSDRGLLPAGTTDGEIGANGEGENSSADIFTPSAPIDPAFHTVLDGFLFNSTPFGQLNVTLDGLEPGRTYQVQLFTTDDRDCCANRNHEWSDRMFPSGNRSGQFTGGGSSYVIGEFTPDRRQQQLFQESTARQHVFNAYILRDVTEVASVDEDGIGSAAASASLLESYPNPFHQSTRIKFALPEPEYVSLRIYDSAGRFIRSLAEGELRAQEHVREWDGRDEQGERVSSGVYFSRLEAGDSIHSKAIVVTQ